MGQEMSKQRDGRLTHRGIRAVPNQAALAHLDCPAFEFHIPKRQVSSANMQVLVHRENKLRRLLAEIAPGRETGWARIIRSRIGDVCNASGAVAEHHNLPRACSMVGPTSGFRIPNHPLAFFPSFVSLSTLSLDCQTSTSAVRLSRLPDMIRLVRVKWRIISSDVARLRHC